MKRILFIAGGVLAVLLIALAVLPYLIPGSVYKTQIERAASNALGRDVAVAGDVSISIFPVIAASVEDVTVANPEGFDEPNMIEAGALKGSVRILPLLSRRVEVSELTFKDARVSLTRLEDGRVNWTLNTDNAGQQDPSEPSGNPFSASIDRASLQNASLIYADRRAGTRYELTELDLETALRNFDQPLSVKASGAFQGQPFNAGMTLTSPQSMSEGADSVMDFELGSDLGNVRFDGTLRNTAALSISGDFSVSVPQLSAAAAFLDLDLPISLQPLGAFNASGNVAGTVPDLMFDFKQVSLVGDGLNATYDGLFDLSENGKGLSGNGSLTVRNADALAKSLGINIPQLAPVQQVSVKTKLSGPTDELEFAQMNARVTSPTLSTTYTGDISLAGAGKIEGQLNAESTEMRSLLQQLGVILPDGDALNRFRVAGHTTGTLQQLTIQEGTFLLDETEAKGSFGADLRGETPKVVADLALSRLDLSPFLGDQSAAKAQPSGWSDEPLDLAALGLVNADLKLRADTIDAGAVKLQNANLSALLQNGVLSATLDRFSTFGGDWAGKVNVDASRTVPTYTFSMAAVDVHADTLLGTLAGYRQLAGLGDVTVDVSSTGTSMNQIVNQLDGALELNLADGALKGVNLGQLVRSAGSLQEALSSGTLSLANLGDVVSPQAQTDFTTFRTALNVRDGVAAIDSLTLANSVLDVSGAGQINIGGRTLDIKLTPAIDRSGQGESSVVQLNGIPVPLRISGSWTAPQFTPDFSGVRSALQNDLRQRAGSAIGDRIGGDLGTIVSGAIGGSQAPQGAAESPSQAEVAEEEPAAEQGVEEEPAPDEDTRERAIRDAIGSIFGPN